MTEQERAYFEQFSGEDEEMQSIILVKGLKPEELQAALDEWRKTYGYLYPPNFIQEFKIVGKS